MGRFIWAALCLAAGVWLWGWLAVDETGQPVTQIADEPQAEIEGLQPLTVRQAGKPLWEISARRVSVAADGTSTLATGIERALLFRDGQPFLHLDAARLRLANRTSNLEASGGVSASGQDGFTFQTARAVWQNALKTVQCPQPVSGWLRDIYFTAPRLAYQWDAGILTCPQTVELRTQGAVFRGKNLQATLKTRQIVFSGGVQIIFAPRAVQKAISRKK